MALIRQEPREKGKIFFGWRQVIFSSIIVAMEERWQIKGEVKSKEKQKRREEIINLLLSNRGIPLQEKEIFFNPPSPKSLTPREVGLSPATLAQARRKILAARKKKQKILIFGDYDVDGICGTAILWEALWQKGFDVLPYLPKRSEGYGISAKTVARLKKENPDLGLVITVDNGIVAKEEIEGILRDGLEVIVSDHHLKQEKKTPKATLVWSPKICGAAVAYFLAAALTGDPDGLDLVGLATAADLMPQTMINRIFLKAGIRSLRQTRRPGLLALFDEAQIQKDGLDSYHLGYIICPRLNATGRLDDAMDSLRLLCTRDVKRAAGLAKKLGKENQARQSLTQKALWQAEEEILKNPEEQRLIFIYSPDFHPGIIGLVAGKIADKFCRPTVVATAIDGIIKASCRSPEGFNILSALKKIEDCFIDLGGHPRAAGLSFPKENLVKVKKALYRVGREVDTRLLVPKLNIDAQVRFSDLSFSLWEILEKFAPFGLGNSEPLFSTADVIIGGIRKMGQNGAHLRLILDDLATRQEEKKVALWLAQESEAVFDGVGFNMGNLDLKVGDRVAIAYHLSLNEWQGRRNLELRLVSIRKKNG
ncbi:DHH family phosphoesterase [Candidatus Shapirobacteria bacterium]|nr:DHH family phosphoesterase [Candidatus Shapirobacteria bacterium]